jgi:8-oxo-dGTP pyrophosphatase MutT (NUDIX family)
MPQAVSRKQWRMMQAILHGKGGGDGPRGRPPKSIAAKYTAPGKDAPEQDGEDRGGTWGEEHHKRAKDKVKAARKTRKEEKKKSKQHLKKSFEEFYKGNAAATLIVDNTGRVLLGRHSSGGIAFPGGHVEIGESFEAAALRELKEEAGIVGRLTSKIYQGKQNGNECAVFLTEVVSGKPKDSSEFKEIKWYEPQDIPWNKLRDCCVEPLEEFVTNKLGLGKTLRGMMAMENLEKNIIRQRGEAVFEVTHGDSLRVVGNGLFRRIRNEVKDMKDEDFKDIKLDTYTVSIRKHISDVYSGRVSDGHKIIHQFVNKSLPQITVELMSVFEWYLPEDQADLDILDEGALSDDAIEGGLNHLMDAYKKHNIGNIYAEMETIREQMRNGVAVDLQQVESRMMKLFDKLEDAMHSMADKHNDLAQEAGKDLDELEAKMRELQAKIEEVEKRPQTVEAYSPAPNKHKEILENFYPYLSRPQIEIDPTGRMKISFSQDWQNLEKENFLKDMKARIIKKVDK